MEQIQIELKLPDEPFIAVFGSSHTHGDCRRGESQHIAKDQIWTSLLSKSLGIRVVNFAVPGNDNRIITQQIIDLFEQPGSENCQLIIAEVRYGSNTFDLAHSTFSDISTQHIVSPLWAGADFEQKWWKQEVFSQIAVGKLNPDYARSIIAKAMNIQVHSQAPQQAVDLLLSAADGFSKVWCTGHMSLIYDLQSIRTMAALAESKGVPFKWFCWSTIHLHHNQNPNAQHLHDIFEKTTRVFDSVIPEFENTVVKGFEKIFGESEYNSTLCECKHNDEVMHSWVADQIQPSITQALSR